MTAIIHENGEFTGVYGGRINISCIYEKREYTPHANFKYFIVRFPVIM